MRFVPLVERLTRRSLVSKGVESKYVDTDVGRMHVYDAPGVEDPAAPTVVLLHGISSSATPFAPILQRLRKHAGRVIAVEAPGHGLSEPPRVALTPDRVFEGIHSTLCSELRGPAAVVGNSLGGAMAVHFALREPGLVRGLFLTSPAGAHMHEEAFDGFLRVFDLKTHGEARAFFRRLYHRPPWYSVFAAPEVRAMFARPMVREILEAARTAKLFTPEELASLKMPIHVLWGKSDRLMPRENLEYYRQHLPGHAVFEEPENMGHCPHLDAPAVFSEKVAKFLEELRPEAAS